MSVGRLRMAPQGGLCAQRRRQLWTLYQDKGVDDRQDTTLGQLIAQQQKEKMLAAAAHHGWPPSG